MPLTQVQNGMLAGVIPASLGGTGTTAGVTGFKNRLINGDMTIDQRNNGASVSLTSGGGFSYAADRWYVENATDGTATIQQITDAPTGFSNSIRYTVTATDSSLASDQSAFIQQRIEGFNFADMLYGTANAQTVTVSFWVKSSVTGTFGLALANSAYNRGYPASFTVVTANTWEQKSVTIAGDTTGTWIGSTNGIGVRVSFGIAVGSARSSTAGAWAAAVVLGVTGQVNLMATNGATFQVSGVQLEKGSSATNFDYLPYGTELQLCQRYFQPITNYVGSSQTASSFLASYRLAVPMRAAPIVSLVNNTFGITSNAADYQTTSAAIDYFDNLINPPNYGGRFRITGFSGLPTPQFGFTGLSAGSAPNFGINASAEL
jgi:hypothetical protein